MHDHNPGRRSPHIVLSLHIVAITLLVALLSTAGCGDSKSGETTSDGRKIVRIAHWWGDAQSLWDSVIVEFEKSHPDIHVEQEVMSFNVLKDKVLTQSAAGEHVGDLIPLEDWFAQELVQRDYFVDLAGWVERDLKPEEYFPISLGTFKNGATLRAFPVALGSYPLYYNIDIFKAAGERFPDSTWTFDTLRAVAQRLTRDTDGDGKPEQWGFLLDNSGGFDGAIWSLGGAVLTDDMKKSAFNEPRTIAALHFWVDLVRKYKVAPQNASLLGGTSSGGAMRPFETGRFAMAMLGSHTVGPTTSFAWNIALPPKGLGGRKSLRFAAAFGIPKTSKNPEAAWEFLRWIEKEMPSRYAARMFYGLVPNSPRLASSPEFLESAPKIDRSILIAMIEHYSFSYWRTHWLEFRDQGFLPEVDQMISGEKTVEAGAAAAEARINEVLGAGN